MASNLPRWVHALATQWAARGVDAAWLFDRAWECPSGHHWNEHQLWPAYDRYPEDGTPCAQPLFGPQRGDWDFCRAPLHRVTGDSKDLRDPQHFWRAWEVWAPTSIEGVSVARTPEGLWRVGLIPYPGGVPGVGVAATDTEAHARAAADMMGIKDSA